MHSHCTMLLVFQKNYQILKKKKEETERACGLALQARECLGSRIGGRQAGPGFGKAQGENVAQKGPSHQRKGSGGLRGPHKEARSMWTEDQQVTWSPCGTWPGSLRHRCGKSGSTGPVEALSTMHCVGRKPAACSPRPGPLHAAAPGLPLPISRRNYQKVLQASGHTLSPSACLSLPTKAQPSASHADQVLGRGRAEMELHHLHALLLMLGL